MTSHGNQSTIWTEKPEYDILFSRMLEYLQEHQPGIEIIWYYPKFVIYSLVDLYSTEER